MVVEAILLGLILGKLRSGSFKNLGRFALKLPVILIIGFLGYVVTSLLVFFGNDFVVENLLYLKIGIYLLLFVVLFFNLQYRSVWLILFGTLSNFTAIVLNDGRMPLDPEALEQAGMVSMETSLQAGTLHNYINIEAVEGFTANLGKFLATPEIYPFSQVFSPGDVFIAVGVFFLVQRAMTKVTSRFRSVRFDHQRERFR
ncbi:DUF5317 domain-containing protein [Isachenkonia alkalipeptolytica]|uniref:DUF5317 domain-containing protein n=1 Tax=Isachenkonia alkalipeptolytica TaxID=2565777 RepID=A0AA43XM69_9CLOT|nr:hypothetical protein [Isachenkonia alkalipeptolytica]